MSSPPPASRQHSTEEAAAPISLSPRPSFDWAQGCPMSPFAVPQEAHVKIGSDTDDTSPMAPSRSLSQTLTRQWSIMTEPPIPEADITVEAHGIASLWPSIRMELRRTFSMAVPLLFNNVANFLMTVVILSYVGHLGSEALACATLGGSLFNVLGQSLFIGCASTLETLCGQAVGAGNYKLLGLHMMRCIFMITAVMPLFAALYWKMDVILAAMGQDPVVAQGAASYLLILTPALWLMGVTECLKRGLVARGIVLPNMTIAIFTSACTPFYAWFFVTYLGYGFLGGAYAIVAAYASNALCFLCTNAVVNWQTYGTPEYAWPGWSLDMLRGLSHIIKLAVPTTMMICLDWWTWESMILLAGLLPNPDVNVAVMGLGFNVVALCFMVPLAITATSSIGIANFLGANQPKRARLAQYVGVGVAAVMLSVLSVAAFLGRNQIGQLYTSDPAVLELLNRVMPLLSIILWCDGWQNVWTSGLRGSGRQAVGATINLGVLWGFGVPLAAILAFHFKMGTIGMWYALLAAFAIQAVIMTTTVVAVIDMPREAERAQERMAEPQLYGRGGDGGEAGEGEPGRLEEPLLGSRQASGRH